MSEAAMIRRPAEAPVRRPTICLCMIVRDEAHVIERALESVRPWIDAWAICDTGSTDGTPERVAAALEGIPGMVHHHPWVDFGTNRSRAIAQARRLADYVLILDADMTVRVADPDFKAGLVADRYWLRYDDPELDYSQVMLVSSRHDWRFVGVTHEYVDTDAETIDGVLPALALVHHGDGGNRASKYIRDVALLTRSLEADPADTRAMFYLAESFAQLGRHAEARDWFRARAAAGGWEEERWFASYRAAVMDGEAGAPWPEVSAALLGAWAARPQRIEPLYDIVRHHRLRSEYAQGYAFAAMAGHGLGYPDDHLFIARAVHTHLFAFEYGLCALALGRLSEAIVAFNAVLGGPDTPATDVAATAREGRRVAALALHPTPARPASRAARLVVAAPFRNAGPFLARHLASIREQTGVDLRAVYADDASTDGAASVLPDRDPRIKVINRAERMGAAFNLHDIVANRCDPDEIVVCLDGDDWLAAPDALSAVAALYDDPGCWLSWGQFETPDGRMGFAQPFASETDFRGLRLGARVTHLRTFRAGLLQAIAGQDPGFDCLKDAAGRWLTTATDAAATFPMLELAGFHRVRFNDRILVICNDANPLSHHAQPATRAAQAAAFAEVQGKRPFARLTEVPAWA
jgi:glycosyltransferase involved in cell wall biosynthesis